MDSSKTLIRSVVRALYDTRHVLVIDALMIHSTFVDNVPLLVGATEYRGQAFQRRSRASAEYAAKRPTQIMWATSRGSTAGSVRSSPRGEVVSLGL